MRTQRTKAAMACLVAAWLSHALPAGAAEPLGRLFLTPKQRAALEQQRQHKNQDVQILPGSALRLDGVVQRSSGAQTIWINGQAQHDDAAPSELTARLQPGTPGQATIRVGEAPPAPLRVGETIQRDTRKKSDLLAGGTLVVHPQDAAR